MCMQFEKRANRFMGNSHENSKRRELEKIFESAKKKGKRYDCLVPVSGGFDSTYVLYVCKRVYDLKILALNFDNGFKSDFAEQNLEKSVSRLDVDYKVFKPDWDISKELYALFFRKTGEFCTPCNAGIWSSSYKIAKEMGIPLIVRGSSGKIEEQLPPSPYVYSWSTGYFRKVCKPEIPLELVQDYLYYSQSVLQSISRLVSRHISMLEGVRIISLPSFLDWDVKSILRTLETEMDWQHPPNKYRHVDCIMDPVRVFLTQKKLGFSAAAWYSTLVRNGKMTREEALRRTIYEEGIAAQEPPELKVWMEMLGLSNNDLEGFQRRSQSSFVPSKERLWKIAENMVQKMLTLGRLKA